MGYLNKKAHRLPLASMSSHYVEAHKTDFEKAYNYAQGRTTSMGLGAILKEKEADKQDKPTGLIGKARMIAGQIMPRLFSHRKV